MQKLLLALLIIFTIAPATAVAVRDIDISIGRLKAYKKYRFELKQKCKGIVPIIKNYWLAPDTDKKRKAMYMISISNIGIINSFNMIQSSGNHLFDHSCKLALERAASEGLFEGYPPGEIYFKFSSKQLHLHKGVTVPVKYAAKGTWALLKLVGGGAKTVGQAAVHHKAAQQVPKAMSLL